MHILRSRSRFAETQEVHIWRWIYHAERAVNIEGVDTRLEIPALREHDLKDVSRGNVFFRPLDGRDVLLLRSTRANCELLLRGGLSPIAWLPSCSEFLFNAVDVANRSFIRGLRRITRDVGRCHDVNLVKQMIENQ